VNLGGQLVPAEDLEQLKTDVKAGRLNTWQAIHEEYDRLWERYPLDKQRHAFATLLDLLAVDSLTPELWAGALQQAVEIQQYVADQTYLTRKKDYDDAFRKSTYDSEEEMKAVLGTAEENSFVKQVRSETEQFTRQAEAAAKLTA
jgi:hypothetical protein